MAFVFEVEFSGLNNRLKFEVNWKEKRDVRVQNCLFDDFHDLESEIFKIIDKLQVVMKMRGLTFRFAQAVNGEVQI